MEAQGLGRKQDSLDNTIDNGNLDIVLKDDGDDTGMEVCGQQDAAIFEDDVTVKAEHGKARLQPNPDAQLEAMNQAVSSYSKALGDFGSDLAIRSRKRMDPAIWWETYSMDCPELRDIAIKVLSQTCSSYGFRSNHSMLDLIHTKRRNRLTTTKLDKLIYVHYNLRLHARHTDRDTKYYNPINLDYIFHEDPTEEWLVERDPSVFPDEQPHVLNMADRSGSGAGAHMDMNDEDEYICSGDGDEDDDGDNNVDGENKKDTYEMQPAGDMDEGYYQPPYDYELGDMNLPRQLTWF
ncbi:hypothetical protein EJ110_NYTH28156 [Nymphaea thermarum]|nr:hypothetical protein EJ110_NYTH28156 [Nymphaea thermarum]